MFSLRLPTLWFSLVNDFLPSSINYDTNKMNIKGSETRELNKLSDLQSKDPLDSKALLSPMIVDCIALFSRGGLPFGIFA